MNTTPPVFVINLAHRTLNGFTGPIRFASGPRTFTKFAGQWAMGPKLKISRRRFLFKTVGPLLRGTPQRLTHSMVHSALMLALGNLNTVGDRLAEPAGVLQASHQRVAREASRVSTRSFKMVPACRTAALARFPSRDGISALQPITMSLSVARSTPDASPGNP
jgi:hypothetical protein